MGFPMDSPSGNENATRRRSRFRRRFQHSRSGRSFPIGTVDANTSALLSARLTGSHVSSRRSRQRALAMFLEMYGNRMRRMEKRDRAAPRASRVGKQEFASRSGNGSSPADLFADLICDLDRARRYLWPGRVDIPGTAGSYLHTGMNKYGRYLRARSREAV